MPPIMAGIEIPSGVQWRSMRHYDTDAFWYCLLALVEAMFVLVVRKCIVIERRRIRTCEHFDTLPFYFKFMYPLFKVVYPKLSLGFHVLHAFFTVMHMFCTFVPALVQFQIVVASNDEFQRRVNGFDIVDCTLEVGLAANLGEIATVQENVGTRCGVVIGVWPY